jgi:hypothetical protein
MHQSCSPLALALILLAAATTASAAKQTCKPVLSAKSSGYSDAINQQHRWTGVFAVDASQCATNSGIFELRFVREKELGPDLAFAERFIWRPGQTEARLDLWWDEWLGAYRLGEITSCPCRTSGVARKSAGAAARSIVQSQD